MILDVFIPAEHPVNAFVPREFEMRFMQFQGLRQHSSKNGSCGCLI